LFLLLRSGLRTGLRRHYNKKIQNYEIPKARRKKRRTKRTSSRGAIIVIEIHLITDLHGVTALSIVVIFEKEGEVRRYHNLNWIPKYK